MSYQRHVDSPDQVRATAEKIGAGKAEARGSGRLPGPQEFWDKDELQLLRLRNARARVQELLDGLDGDIQKIEAKLAKKRQGKV